MKLNPKKCSFGMQSGKFLGMMVSNEGIRACPKKVEAVLQMGSPTSVKDVQVLNGRLVALHRFVAKAAERSLPFMKVLKECLGKENFQWTQEAEDAFAELKKVLTELPTLTAPTVGETLQMYIAATIGSVSAVLVAEREQGQMPVYYVSKVLKDYEKRYAPMERLVLALVVAARRLRRYFQAHCVEVLTSYPINQVLRKPEMSGRMVKWAVELGQFDIQFKSRVAVKGQVVADFLAEMPVSPEESTVVLDVEKVLSWKLFTDGSTGSEGAGAGILIVSPDGDEMTYAIRFNFGVSNNEAEYEAVLAGLRMMKMLEAHEVQVCTDSLLVVKHISGDYETKSAAMALYLDQVKVLMKEFNKCEVAHVTRSQNKKADVLSKLASTSFKHLGKEIRVEVLDAPSILKKQVSDVAMTGPVWYASIYEYLTSGRLPEGKEEARKVKVKSLQYQIQEGMLYRRTYVGPLLKCLTEEEAVYVISEVHKGICGNHMGPRMVVNKLILLGYYWPNMHKFANDILKRCDECQRFAPVSLKAKHEMVPIVSAWPFQKWGIDIVGPFPEAAGRVKFLIVAVDYFTKWVEAKAVANITGAQVKKFVWEYIICRFGLPLYIISDNGKQFADNPFREWCEELAITQIFASVAYPQANGQVERVNRSLVEGIKTRLGKAGGGWVDELAHVLWAYRTMPKTANGETPFSLTYGSEAVIPAEVGVPTRRMLEHGNNDDLIRENLDMLEERREVAAIREGKYKAKMEKYYNAHAKIYYFKEGDLVLRNNDVSKVLKLGKLTPQWEGPYKISEVLGKGSYVLEDGDGKVLPRSWNGIHLRKYHV
ncbi:hypothetical protein SSX86_030915 [Deinandra increscens subsp. villosa]|uniref:Uncharacterized protein n=1 Tax=Deinandra increscens subsp. villosa TaxID=3103831 RepID=A0AAP0GJI2_9ASTR